MTKSNQDTSGIIEVGADDVTMQLKLRAADEMAWICDDWVLRNIIGSRSALADARLSYGDPFTYAWSKLEAPSVSDAPESDSAKPLDLPEAKADNVSAVLVKSLKAIRSRLDKAPTWNRWHDGESRGWYVTNFTQEQIERNRLACMELIDSALLSENGGSSTTVGVSSPTPRSVTWTGRKKPPAPVAQNTLAPCPPCGGSGWIQDSMGDSNCGTCGGTGVVTPSFAPCPKRWTPEWVINYFGLNLMSKAKLIADAHNASLPEQEARPAIEHPWRGIPHTVRECQWINCEEHSHVQQPATNLEGQESGRQSKLIGTSGGFTTTV